MKFAVLAATALLLVCPLFADNVLHPGTPVLDRPTLITLGVQFPITGDDNFNATITVQYRVTGTTTWKQGLNLFRVHPESTVSYTLVPQFAGSIFNLQPNTTYDIQLHAVDTDGPVDQTFMLTGTTRAVPADPPNPHVVNVSDVTGLNAAIGAAQPGDVIQLADGLYNVASMYVWASGTAQNPIVIRGTTQNGTILDGGNCSGCNIIEVYGSYVHIESMTLQNADRAIRFFNATQGNVVRRVHVKNTTLGIHGNNNQLDYYLADNILEGRLTWPQVYGADGGVHASDTGITVPGFGNVVCHNQISGYGDAMEINQTGARAIDVYGNDVLWTYDNAIELDYSEGNTRAFRNRFTNTWDTLSVQPILGGPAYMFQNVVINAADEQMKFHAIITSPPQEPNGVLAYHNTFVSPKIDLNMCSPNNSHHFWIENNLFVGPAVLNNTLSKAALWCGGIDDGHFDYNGYWPDGPFSFNLPAAGGGYAYFNTPNLAAFTASGLETHGLILPGVIFGNGLIGPPDYTILQAPQNWALAPGSSAIDRGIVLPNINDGFTGAAPDLGALEVGCPSALYGPRPVGVDETNEPIGCASGSAPTPDFVISNNPGTVTVPRGQSGNSTVTVSSLNGFDNAVSLTVSGCPANATCSMNPTGVAPTANGSATSQLTVTTTSNTAIGTVTLTIGGTGPATVHSTTATLTVNPGAPASITATAGITQSAPVSTAFATALQATVKDAGGSPVSGATVTFTAPSSGASASFGGSATTTAVTNSSGQATAPSLAANSQTGSYTVTASVAGVATPASFSLTNSAATGSSDLAVGKTATQSSTLAGYGSTTVASSAVNGNTDGNFSDGSVSHTNDDANAWWQVDLGSSTTIGSIAIWNRTDCCSDRLSDYWVFVSNTPFLSTDTPTTLQSRTGTWSSHQTSYPNPSITIGVNSQGRYVRVQLSGTNYLSLAEVQVFGSGSGTTTYGISGQVAMSGVTVTLSGSQSGSVTSNASGNYSFTGLAAAGNFTVTPSLSGYTFTPPSQTFNNLGASQTANFTASAVTNNSDLAVGKTTAQSSTLAGYGSSTVASSAVDGNTDGNFSDGSVSHTNDDANAWWEVDLGASATIGSIAIWNRTDCCMNRLNDYWVFVSNTPFLSTDTPATLQARAGTWSGHQTSYPNPSTTIAVNTQGRYVRVQLSGTNYLSLAEVQVFGSGSGTTTYGISGQVTMSGVTVTLSGSQSGSVTSNASGNYSFTGLAAAGNYTVTPSMSGYSFTPPSQTFNSLSASQTASFTATAVTTNSNLALGKTATQSSTIAGYGPTTVASSAVDGNTDGNFSDCSVSHTNDDANAWWEVDLGASATISSIAIWDRTDCCSNRLSDYWVFVSNTPFMPADTPATLQVRAATWSSHQTSYPNPSTTIAVSTQGRYVRVQLSGTNYLSLAEVQVFGH